MTEQEKMDKVIKALECCTKKVCIYKDTEKKCPYWELCGEYESSFEDCTTALAKDALALLKAQKPRVMTLEELIGIYNFRENHSWVYDTPPYLYLDNRAWIGYWVSWSNIVGCLEGQEAGYKVEKYGKRWRCWTSRPTDEQREAEVWND